LKPSGALETPSALQGNIFLLWRRRLLLFRDSLRAFLARDFAGMGLTKSLVGMQKHIGFIYVSSSWSIESCPAPGRCAHGGAEYVVHKRVREEERHRDEQRRSAIETTGTTCSAQNTGLAGGNNDARTTAVHAQTDTAAGRYTVWSSKTCFRLPKTRVLGVKVSRIRSREVH
jgi:hypothetical protein